MAHPDTLPDEAVAASNVLIVDGCVLDPETGEMIEALGRGGKQTGQKWEPKDNADVDWILWHTARAESEIALIDARIKRLNAAKQTAKATAAFFRDQWKMPLLALAKAVISTVSGKGSTVKYDYGDLQQVRSFKDRRVKITDKAKLAGILEAHGYGIAVTRTFPVVEQIDIDKDSVPDSIWDAIEGGTLLSEPSDDAHVLGPDEHGCEVKPPGDELVIKTPKPAKGGGDD